MTSAYLTVKFIRKQSDEFPGFSYDPDSAHHNRVLREEYHHQGIFVDTVRKMSNTRYYLEGKVVASVKPGDTPAKILFRERARLAARSVNYLHAKGDFVIEKLTVDDVDYVPENLMLDELDDASATIEKIDSNISNHPSAKNVSNWLRMLVNSEGLKTSQVIARINEVLLGGQDSLGKRGRVGFLAYLKENVPALPASISQSDMQRDDSIWSHLQSAAYVLEHLSKSHFLADSANPEDILKRLYAGFTDPDRAQISESQLHSLLSVFGQGTEVGLLFRLGIFVGTQIGLESIAGKIGVADLAKTHENIASTFTESSWSEELSSIRRKAK